MIFRSLAVAAGALNEKLSCAVANNYYIKRRSLTNGGRN
jgi:hypothetical protein